MKRRNLQRIEKVCFFKKSACSQSLSPLGHSVGFASCKAWCVLISASMPNCPLSPGKGVNTGTGVPATRLGATPKARMLWLLAKSFARCKTSRASNAKHPFLITIEVFQQSADILFPTFFIFPIDKSPVSVYTVYITHKQFDYLLCDVSLRI